jgi:hypothetical protein
MPVLIIIPTYIHILCNGKKMYARLQILFDHLLMVTGVPIGIKE